MLNHVILGDFCVPLACVSDDDDENGGVLTFCFKCFWGNVPICRMWEHCWVLIFYVVFVCLWQMRSCKVVVINVLMKTCLNKMFSVSENIWLRLRSSFRLLENPHKCLALSAEKWKAFANWWKLHAAQVCMRKRPPPFAVWLQWIASLSSGPARGPRRGFHHRLSWPNHHPQHRCLCLKPRCRRNSTRHLLCLRPRSCLIGQKSAYTSLHRPKYPSHQRHQRHHHHHHLHRLRCRLLSHLWKPYSLSQGSSHQGYFHVLVFWGVIAQVWSVSG